MKSFYASRLKRGTVLICGRDAGSQHSRRRVLQYDSNRRNNKRTTAHRAIRHARFCFRSLRSLRAAMTLVLAVSAAAIGHSTSTLHCQRKRRAADKIHQQHATQKSSHESLRLQGGGHPTKTSSVPSFPGHTPQYPSCSISGSDVQSPTTGPSTFPYEEAP